MLPTDSKARKAIPVWSGCIAYFPNALVAIAGLSQRANNQHNPGEPLHWAMEKSTDEQDAGMRHAIEPLLIGASEYDADGTAHKVKKAWRACAELERWLLAGNQPFAPPTPAYQFNPGDLQKLCDAGPGPVIVTHGALHLRAGSGASGKCYYCGGDDRAEAPKSCPCPNNHLPAREPDGDTHMPPTPLAPVAICGDCGVDLNEGMHDAGCLSYAARNRQHW
jgi:hypothetical protein